MQGELIVVFGGSGFIGKQVVRALVRQGKRVRVAMRRPHLGAELRVTGDVGQVQLVQANLRYPESVERALEGADGVVNLVALLYEKGPQNFRDVHVGGARAVAEAARKAGVQRFVHVSAIGADPRSASAYGRTKAEAEEAVRAALPEAVIVRPSVVFGPEDRFLNRFAEMAALAPALPLIGGGTRLQPVYVGDVAQAIAHALDRPLARGKVFELGGPRVYTFRELLTFVLDTVQRKRGLLPLPFFVAGPLGALCDGLFRLTPFAPPLTGQQVAMLRQDNVVSPGALGLADLGVEAPESVEVIAPGYLWRFRPYGQFQTSQRPL